MGSNPTGGSLLFVVLEFDSITIVYMTQCIYCNETTSNPKFCNRSCSASYNNHASPKRQALMNSCLYCHLATQHPNKYCSIKCHKEHQYQTKIDAWIAGRLSGLSCGVVTAWVKRWLREERGNRCEICGWDEINPVTGLVPVVADHIDGNWQNNRPENLRLLCPNHDSLQPTYKALNKGNGRSWRRAEARS